jgi:UDP-glucose 4-epimerase
MAQGFEAYEGKRCLVTGGLGFIGSNLARRLVDLGAVVRLIDNRSPGQGANDFNLAGVSGVDVIEEDVGDDTKAGEAVGGQDFVFNLAGKSSHTDVLESPFADMEANVRAQLVLLEAIRHHAAAARVVYASTRSIYGAVRTRPVDEDHPFLPTEVNSADKAAADLYHLAYAHSHGLNTVCLRLTNIYGPRMLLAHSRQGFINWFVRLVLEGKPIQLFGDGSQERDMLYVQDTVDAFLQAGLAPNERGTAFNIGSGIATSLREIAETLVELTGRGSVTYAPFPEDAKRVEIGDYITDTTRSEQRLGWRATTPLREGLRLTCVYYESNLSRYVTSPGA